MRDTILRQRVPVGDASGGGPKGRRRVCTAITVAVPVLTMRNAVPKTDMRPVRGSPRAFGTPVAHYAGGSRSQTTIGWVAAKGAGSAFGAGQGVGALQFATAAVKWLPV